MAISKRRISIKKDEAARFIVVGIGVVFIGVAIYYLLYTFKVNHNISYATAYIVSTAFNFFASTLFTFKSRLTFGRAVTFSLSHVICLLVHITTLNVMIHYLKVPDTIAPLLVMIMMMPLNFTLIRFALLHDFERSIGRLKCLGKRKD